VNKIGGKIKDFARKESSKGNEVLRNQRNETIRGLDLNS